MAVFPNLSQDDQKLTRLNLIIGCVTAVISSACQSLGLILQRKAHILSNEERQFKGQAESPYKRSMWHIGFLLFISANIFGSTIQIVNLPLIALSPLQSLGLVFNSILSSLMLHEPFTLSSMMGTALVASGAFIIAFFGGKMSELTTSLPIFLQLIRERLFVVWSLFSISIVVILLLMVFLVSRKSKVINFYMDTYVYTFTDLPWVVHHSAKLEGILYGCSSGILSAGSLLLAKASMDIIISAFTKHSFSNLNSPVVYFIIAVFIILCLSQLYLLNQGLKYLSTAVLYPLVFCVYNFFSIGNGLIFYQQWKLVTFTSAALLLFGSTMVVYGVFLLSSEKQIKKQSEHHMQPSKSVNSPGGEDITFISHSNLTSSTTRLLFPSTCDSTRSLHSYSGDDIISSPIETSTLCGESTTNELGSQSHASSGNNSFNLPATSMRHSFSNAGEFLSPIIKSTTENLNSAGRKVSGFFRKSINNLHGKSASIESTAQVGSFSKRMESSFTRGESNERDSFEVPEYISFGSLKDGSSFIRKYDSINDSLDSDNGASSVSGRDRSRNLVTKINSQHKLRRKGSKIRSPNTHKLFDSFRPSVVGRRKQKVRVATDFPHVNSLGPMGSVSTLQDNELDDDYNPSNTFNYSLNNTVEEIQSQMNEIDNKTSRLCSGVEGQDILNNDQHSNFQVPLSQVELKKKDGKIGLKFARYQSPEHDGLYIPKHVGKARNFTTGIIPSARNHRRNLSFEQSELLDELNGAK